jgi:hypothetical protein
MKAKYSIRTITAILSLIAFMPVQEGLSQTYISGSGNTVINNYHMDDFGYHYSSRINRFHRSYSSFE